MKIKAILLNFKTIFLNIFFLINLSVVYSQTTYTFTNSYDASWSNAPNWSPSYPGETINSGDTVIIDVNAGCHTSGLEIVNNGTIIIKSLGFLILDAGSIFQFTNNGVIENFGDIIVGNNNTLINNGEIINNSILTGVGSHTIVNNTGALINNNDVFSINDQGTNDGEINNNDTGKLSVSGLLTNNNIINNLGTMYGFNGVINPNNNFTSGLLSIIEPTTTSSTLTSYGDLDLESSTLNINIDGINQENGVFAVVGNAIIEDAKLDIIWTEQPTSNASYTVMTFASRTGTFSSVNIPPITGYNFNVSYTDTEVKIEVTENGLDMDDLYSKEKIVVWPNPLGNNLNIDLEEYQKEILVKIFDVFGNEVYNKTYTNRKNLSFDVNLSTGVYFVNLITGGISQKVFKIVKK